MPDKCVSHSYTAAQLVMMAEGLETLDHLYSNGLTTARRAAEMLRRLADDMPPSGPSGGNKLATVRLNEDGSLDEIVADGAEVHLEQMSATHWWLGIDDGTRFRHIGLHSKATIKAVMEGEPSHRPPTATTSPFNRPDGN